MFACVYAVGVCDRSALVELAYGFSPKVEETTCDTVVIDIEGCEMLFGQPRDTAIAIARQAARIGIKANVAIASKPDAAIHAARAFNGVTIIPPGEELNRLGDLPMRAAIDFGFWILDFGLTDQSRRSNPKSKIQNPKSPKELNEARKLEEALETLETWGVRTFRELAALPEAGVAGRLGPLGVKLQKLARGTNIRPLLLKKQAPIFERSLDLDDAVELLEPLSFILSRLLNQLCAALNEYALAANELRVRLKLEDRTEIERLLRLPIAMRDPRTFLKLLMLDIESHPPQRAITAVSIAAEPAPPRSIQKGLFQPLAPEPEKLELTIARLVKLVGAGNIGSPELLDTHRPGAFRMKRFGVKRTAITKRRKRDGNVAGRKRSSRLQPAIQNPKSKIQNFKSQLRDPQSGIRNPLYHLGFRVFRPPLRAKVELVSGRPARISARSQAMGRSISGKVLRAAGPWRTSGEWWMKDKWDRSEWDVSVGDSKVLCRVYQELQSGLWFVEGVYD